MALGLLVGSILSLFGAIAVLALIAAHFQANLMAQSLALWIIFVVCFGTGTLTVMMSARGAASRTILGWSGGFALLAGVCAGVLALGKVLGLIDGGQGFQLWLLFALCLPVGVILLASARGLPAE